MSGKTVLVSFIVALLTTVTSAFSADLTEFENKVSHENLAEPNAIDKIVRAYNEQFFAAQSPSNLAKLSSRDVSALYRAAGTVEFYRPQSDYLAHMSMDLTELERRGESTDVERTRYYESLYQAREFGQMNNSFKDHPTDNLTAPIRLAYGSDRQGMHVVLSVVSKGLVLRRHVDLEYGAKILVIAQPLCHFTQYAMQFIEKHKDIKEIFAANSVWIAPADQNTNLTPFLLWNEQHREANTSIADRSESWPEVDRWATPTFIFLKDGKVISSLVGWAKADDGTALRSELAKAGLVVVH